MENSNVDKKGKKKSIDESEGKNEKVGSPKKVAKRSSTLNSTEAEVKKVVKKTVPSGKKSSVSKVEATAKDDIKKSMKTTSKSNKGKVEQPINIKSDSKDALIVKRQSTTKKVKQKIEPVISEIEDSKDDAIRQKGVKKTVPSKTKKVSTGDTSERKDRLEDMSRNKMGKSVTLKSKKEVKDNVTTGIDVSKSVKKSSSVGSPKRNVKELPKEVNIRKKEEPSKVARTRKSERNLSASVSTKQIEKKPSRELNTKKSEKGLSNVATIEKIKGESSESSNKLRARNTASATRKSVTTQNSSATSTLKSTKRESSATKHLEKNTRNVATINKMGQSVNKATAKKPKPDAVSKSRVSANKISSKGTTKVVSKLSEESTGVKRKISQNVEKATSERSGAIKINRSANSSKNNSLSRRSSSGETGKKVSNRVIKDQEPIDEYGKDLNISFLDDEFNEKFDINKLNQELKNRKYVSMEDNMSIVKNSFYNIIFAIVFILFLVFCNYGYYNIEKVAMIKNVNLFSYIFLVVSIMLIETAYKEEKLNKCVNGLETLAMGIFTLFIPYMLQKYTSNFIKALITSGIVIFLYYVIKSIVVFFSNRRKFIRAKDDVSKDNEDGALYFDEEDDDI